VKHEHIITIYQVGEDRGLPYLAMELLHGETLHDRLVRERRLPSAEVVRIGREIADGLALLHQLGLIHRDIKPSNIGLEGARGRVKILDFGLALGPHEGQRSHTGGREGTPQYVAPEQAAGSHVDARADLYSLGGVLYAMIAGKPPQAVGDTEITLRRAAALTPAPLQELNPGVPGGLAELIHGLLAKDPADRPQSATAVADRLAALAKSLDAEQAKPRARRRRRVVGWLVAACLVVSVGLGIAELAGVTAWRRQHAAELYLPSCSTMLAPYQARKTQSTKVVSNSSVQTEGLSPSNAENQLEEHHSHGRYLCRERCLAFVCGYHHR